MNKQNNNNDTIRIEPEGFITKETLAIRLSRTVRTVENWQRRGIIPYVKCGRCVLFKWTDVETHLQTHFRICGGDGRARRPRRAALRSTALPPTTSHDNERRGPSLNSVPSVSSVLKNHSPEHPRRLPQTPKP